MAAWLAGASADRAQGKSEGVQLWQLALGALGLIVAIIVGLCGIQICIYQLGIDATVARG